MNKEQEITLLYQLIEKHFGSGVLMQFEDLTETDNDQLLNRIETMTTYNTYQEAKIANPESEIYVLSRKTALMVGKFQAINDAPTSHFASGWTKCDPSKYCMTVEKFESDGHKLVSGDLYLNLDGIVITYKSGIHNSADETGRNKNRHILRAAALETKEPKRTKVEYVKVTDTGFFELKDEFQGREIFFNQSVTSKPDYVTAMDIIELSHHYMQGNLFRRIETPIDDRQEFIEFVEKLGSDLSADEWSFACLAAEMFDSGRVKLLEQGE